MATLYLMVGLPCSGKTTLARTLEQEHSALRLTPDEWQLRLFGQDAADPQHDARHSLIEALQWEVAERALALALYQNRIRGPKFSGDSFAVKSYKSL